MILFYVETPIQVISAYDLIKSSNQDYILIVRFNQHDHSDLQLQNTLKFLHLKYEGFSMRPGLDLKGFICFLFKFIKNYKRYNKIYIGDFFSKISAIFRLFYKENIIYMDDGVSTIKAIIILNQCNKKETFYTCFFEQKSVYVSLIENRLSSLRSMMDEKQKKITLIIGSWFVEFGIIQKSDYMNMLNKIILSNPRSEKIYIAHREEHDENLQYYAQHLNLKFIKPSLPIELYLIQNRFYPEKIFSSMTSAAFTLRLIFPRTEFELFLLPKNAIPFGSFEHYEACVNYARQCFGEHALIEV